MNVNNNVDNNKMVFSADDRVLIIIKLLGLSGAKTFIAEFSSKPWIKQTVA